MSILVGARWPRLFARPNDRHGGEFSARADEGAAGCCFVSVGSSDEDLLVASSAEEAEGGASRGEAEEEAAAAGREFEEVEVEAEAEADVARKAEAVLEAEEGEGARTAPAAHGFRASEGSTREREASLRAAY